MRIHAVAVDYDGTIAHHGVVAARTRAALETVRAAGRRLALVTGRILDDLLTLDPELRLYDVVVAENGAVLFDPATRRLTVLGEAPPPAFLADLERRGVPFQRGHAIIATVEPYETDVMASIRDLGIGWQVIFNKGAVMALPAGVNKASGLTAALETLGVSPHNVAGMGDAENDHNFLSLCEVAVAVGSALPAIKDRADLVMRRANGSGVVEFIERYLRDDLAATPRVFGRFAVELGATRSGAPVRQPVYGSDMLILGSSGSGKSTLTGVLVERLVEQGYQVCVIDPEGDHGELDPLVALGSAVGRPTIEEIDAALDRAPAGVVINLVAMSPADKLRFAPELLAAVLGARAARGRPHWIVVDEAHHLLPADGAPGARLLPADTDQLCLITMEAGLLAREALENVTHLYVVGERAGEQVATFARLRGLPPPVGADVALLGGEGVIVAVERDRLTRPRRFRVAARRTPHRRHLRKYAGGDLGDSSFYFRGPDGRLNLRAFNVVVFVEMARGVDGETWRYHLARGDVSRWFRDKVKDPELADALAAIEARAKREDADSTRREALRLIEGRYTAGG